MQNFLKEEKVLVCEYEQFRERVKEELGWTDQVWLNRNKGRTELSLAEKIALKKVLDEIRNK